MKPKATNNERYPLKRRPLHNPGESIQREMERLFVEDLAPDVLFAFYTVLFTGYEWLKWFFNLPPQPFMMTAIALVLIGYMVYKFRAFRIRYKALQLGLDGEKAVGQFLEQLRSQGCRVYHDIVGDEFNIDHVVVAPQGIFVIETKTYSKPLRGQAVVNFDGTRILVNGFEPERNAVNQVRALGKWFQNILVESTGRKFPIKHVIVLPGWFVEMQTQAKSDVWVLNPRALPTFIKNESVILKEEDMALIASRLIIHMQDEE